MSQEKLDLNVVWFQNKYQLKVEELKINVLLYFFNLIKFYLALI